MGEDFAKARLAGSGDQNKHIETVFVRQAFRGRSARTGRRVNDAFGGRLLLRARDFQKHFFHPDRWRRKGRGG